MTMNSGEEAVRLLDETANPHQEGRLFSILLTTLAGILLFLLKVFLVVLDFAIMLVTFGWFGAIRKAFCSSKGLRSVPVVEGGGEAHRVKTGYCNNLTTVPKGYENAGTLYDVIVHNFQRYSEHKCMGSRVFLGWKVPNKVKHFDEGIQWKHYRGVGILSHKFGAALRGISRLVPSPETATLEKVTTPCSLAIFENTCPEWMISCLGAYSQSISVTTIYATLGMDAVVDAINEVSIAAIVCNRTNVSKLTDRLDEMPTLRTIVFTDDLVSPEERSKKDMPKEVKKVRIFSFEDFIEMGNKEAFPPTPPKPETYAVIMYTSGSTGKPKGVVANHRMLLATVAGWLDYLPIRAGKDANICYLPLAHILEMVAEFTTLAAGCALCYADPRSLTSTGAYPIGALELYRPTAIAAVPKIWDIIKKGVEARVGASSFLVQFLFQTAFEARSFALRNGYDTPLFKALVFRKLSKMMGGRVRIGVSGGGPLNAEVHKFIRVCFGFPFVQGYGLTETCAGLTLQDMDDPNVNVCGTPITTNEIKLLSTPDVCDKAGNPYLSTDRVDVDGKPVLGRGEILARGGNVVLGYYCMPDATKQVFLEDGFFCTGDIGQFRADGVLAIVDRKKNLVKLKGGEYIAIERMEMVYSNSVFVDAIAGGICCYGDGDMDRPIAMMQLNETVAMKWAADNGMEGSDYETVRTSPQMIEAILSDFSKEHKKGGLSRLEKLVGVAIVNESWTTENGCLTAANKLQRKRVITMFQNDFETIRKKGIF